MKAYLGQECVVSKYGMGRVTSLEKPGYIGVTPYVARYEIQFAERDVDLVQPNTSGCAAFRQELQELNAILENKQDVDLIMTLSLNELRKELLITRASLDESCQVQERFRSTCDQLEDQLKNQKDLMAALKKAFSKEMAEPEHAVESHAHYPRSMSAIVSHANG